MILRVGHIRDLSNRLGIFHGGLNLPTTLTLSRCLAHREPCSTRCGDIRFLPEPTPTQSDPTGNCVMLLSDPIQTTCEPEDTGEVSLECLAMDSGVSK